MSCWWLAEGIERGRIEFNQTFINSSIHSVSVCVCLSFRYIAKDHFGSPSRELSGQFSGGVSGDWFLFSANEFRSGWLIGWLIGGWFIDQPNYAEI